VNEPDVTITNFMLVIESLAFAAVLAARPRHPMRDAWIAVFVTLALGSTCGGLVHGWFPDPATMPYQVLWPLSVAFVIAAAVALAQVTLQFASAAQRAAFQRRVWIAAGGFAAIMLLGYQSFTLAVAAYLPASLVLAWLLVRRAQRLQDRALWLGVAGVLGSVVAGALQQAKYTPTPALGHNAFYHLLQMVALALVFAAAARLCAQPPGEPHARPS